jgi:hypothetical protein
MTSPRDGVFLPASTVTHPASPNIVKSGLNVLDPDVNNQRVRRKTFDQFGPCWNDSEVDELTGYAPPSQRGEGRVTRMYSRSQAGSTVVPVSDVLGRASGSVESSSSTTPSDSQREAVRVPRTDEDWMWTISSDSSVQSVTFHFSPFFREFLLNFFAPFSLLAPLLLSRNASVFFWNRQLHWRQITSSPQQIVRWLALTVFLRGVVWILLIASLLAPGAPTLNSTFDHYPEVIFCWLSMQLCGFFVSVKWAFYSKEYQELISQVKIPIHILRHPEVFNQWLPSILYSKKLIEETLSCFGGHADLSSNLNEHCSPRACDSTHFFFFFARCAPIRFKLAHAFKIHATLPQPGRSASASSTD